MNSNYDNRERMLTVGVHDGKKAEQCRRVVVVVVVANPRVWALAAVCTKSSWFNYDIMTEEPKLKKQRLNYKQMRRTLAELWRGRGSSEKTAATSAPVYASAKKKGMWFPLTCVIYSTNLGMLWNEVCCHINGHCKSIFVTFVLFLQNWYEVNSN